MFYSILNKQNFIGPDSLIGKKQKIQVDSLIVKCEWLDSATNKSVTGDFHEDLLVRV